MSTLAPRLIITDSRGRRQVPVDRTPLAIGRRSECEVNVLGVGVSRRHAEIAAENGSYRLRDLDSKAGTYVNGIRTNDQILAHGDRIRIGDAVDTEITFLVGEDAPRDRTAVSVATELRHMAGLLEGLRALGSGRVLDDVLALVLDSAIQVTGAERGFIMLANEDGTLEYKLGRGANRVTLSGGSFETSRRIPETVFATGMLSIVDDLMDSGIAPQHRGTIALGIRHVLCAPLRLVRFVERADEPGEDKRIGVLYLDSRERGVLQSHSAQTALETLSTEAAVAIENARLYREAVERARIEQELKVAAAIQQSLLPRTNRAGAYFSIAGSSVPCRSVGGDFFDFVDVPDGQFGFVLGDVAGKGPAAALLAAAALGMFGVEAAYQSRCAAVVARLNQGLFRRRIEGRFLTAFYAVLGPDGTLLYCNAGHNAPLLVTSSGIVRLETGGPVLGLFDDAAFEEEAIRLAAGDMVVAFSDGVTEALNEAGEEYAEDRLLGSVHAHRGCCPEELLQALLADVRAFCGRATPTDDVTMVVARYEG